MHFSCGQLLPFLCLLAAGAAPAEEPKGLRLPFPEVKGWKRLPPRQLPPPGDGYSIGYNGPETAVTIYVYNRGLAKVPDDLSSEVVRREMTGAKEAVHEAKRLGYYEEVKEEAAGTGTLGGRKEGRKALYARYRIKVRKEEVRSEIYILPYRNHFLKIRVTRHSDKADKALGKLFAALEAMLAKK
jgi:hypothetical protein